MRRPSGFDREPEPRRQHTPAADDWDAPAELPDPVLRPEGRVYEPGDEPGESPDVSERTDSASRSIRPARSLPAFRWPRRRRAAGGADVDASEVALAEDSSVFTHAAFDATAATVDLSGVAADLAASSPSNDGLAITTDLSAVRERVAAGADATAPADAEFDSDELLVRDLADDLTAIAPEPKESGLRLAEQQLKDAIRGRKRRERREQRRFTWHVRQRRRPWLIAGAGVLAVALFVVVGVFTPLMSVREVRVEGATRVDVAAVEAALAPLTGTPLALLDQAEVHRALVPFPLIQRYAIETIPPHTLVVRLEERVPVLAIPSEAGFDLVDPAGVTVEQSEARPEGVPLAEGVAATRSSAAFGEVARVLRDMPPELRAQFATATASTGQDVSFVMHSGVQVIWGDAEETPRKAVVLSAILNALGERPISLIDVSSSEAPIFR